MTPTLKKMLDDGWIITLTQAPKWYGYEAVARSQPDGDMKRRILSHIDPDTPEAALDALVEKYQEGAQ